MLNHEGAYAFGCGDRSPTQPDESSSQDPKVERHQTERHNRSTKMIRSFFANSLVALAMIAFLMPAQAQLVSTGDALALETGSIQVRVEAFLLQDSVAAELTALGVSHEMAMARVADMSAEELELIAGRIDEMPAGAAGVVYVLGVVFIVLMVMHFFRR